MISGFFDRRLAPRPLVSASIQLPTFGLDWIGVPLVVDTGAEYTCIHASDAMLRFGIDVSSLNPASWPKSTTIVGVGGSLDYWEVPSRITLQHDHGRLDVIDGLVLLGPLRSRGVPSLLGLDVLKLFRLELHGPNQTISLERP